MTDIYIVVESESLCVLQKLGFKLPSYPITKFLTGQRASQREQNPRNRGHNGSFNVREFAEDSVALINLFAFQLLEPLCAKGLNGK